MINQPAWLSQFVDQVLAATAQIELQSDTGCHVYRNSDGEWEVTLFVDSGDEDRIPGLDVWQGALSIDVFELMPVFDELTACRWQSAPRGWDDDLGSHLSVEGAYAGQRIWLRIASRMPACLAEPVIHGIAGN